jgi:hypothetical protein
MRPSPPRIVSLRDGAGVAGSVVVCSIIGTGLDTVTGVGFSGSGLVARMLLPPSAQTIVMAISIAADAAPGPRAVLLMSSHGAIAGESGRPLFHVLTRSSYRGAGGIGSHLI